MSESESIVPPPVTFPGRGPAVNPSNRFERLHVACDAETWQCDLDGVPDERPDPRTHFFHDATESLLTKNDSPDIPFAYGMNVYRGCEHGCMLFSNQKKWFFIK